MHQEPEFAHRWTDLNDRGACRFVPLQNGAPAPTRWEGNRAIDWVWTSHPHMVTSLSFAHTVIADHKAILFEVQYSQDKVQSFQHVPTRSLVQPPTLSHEVWAAALQNSWQTADCPTNSSTEQEWRDFCAIIEETYSEASASSAQVVHQSRPVVGRPKGSELKVQPIAAVTFRLKQHASCHELKARKLWGRVKEANLQIAHHGSAPAVLLHRIWHHPLVRHKGFQTLGEIQKWAETEVMRVVKQDRLTKIQAWKNDMRTDMNKARKWISKQNSLPVTSVHEPKHRNYEASRSNQESLTAIHTFWKHIWERQMPPVNEAFEKWPEMQWRPLSAEELHATAKRQKGSAAGPDGLTGAEISQLPLRAWEILSELLQRWTFRKEIPRVWQSARQVHLQKPDAKLRTQDGAISAKDMRPTSIQCTIWRVIASSWTRRKSIRTWQWGCSKSWRRQSSGCPFSKI